MNPGGIGLHRLLERAWIYDALQGLVGARAARRRFVSELLCPTAGARILDAGCGTGDLLSALPTDVTYVGYDPNSRYIERARRRFGGRGRFYCARAAPTHEEVGGFDAVVASGVLHHLEDEEASALVESAGRALRPGGFFVALDPLRHPGQHPVARALLYLDRGRRIRTPAGYRALLGAAFDAPETRLITDLARVPYSHFFMRARRR